MMTCRLEARGRRIFGLLLLVLGAACSGDGSGGATQDLVACAVDCVPAATPEPGGTGGGDGEPKQIILTGNNYWIGMDDNKANQDLSKSMEQYCLALAGKAGCFGTHGGPGAELEVTPSACQINAVGGGPPYLLIICSGAADGSNGEPSAVDWFIEQTCSENGDVFGCTGTIWVRKATSPNGKRLFCEGRWENGNGPATPDFPDSGISFEQGEDKPAGTDWLPLCG